MRFCCHSRWVLSALLICVAILICVITAANAAHESDGNSALGNSTNETLSSKESKWQMMKKEIKNVPGKLQNFFINDIPHFFSKGIPDKTSQVKSILQREISTVENEVGDIEETIKSELKIIRLQDSCECIQYNCGCCQHLEEPTIHLNSTVCANVTYLSQDIGISVTVTVNGYAIFNETVSVRNPPPVCLGVPYVKEWAEACVRFYDIDATRSHLHACTEVEARMKHILIAKYELGCFDIGPITLKASAGEQQYANEPPSVMLV